MAVGDHHVVGWIETPPAVSGNEDRDPCVGCLSTLDFRTGTHITTDISSRQPHGAQSAYHDVRKILAHPLAFAQHIRQSNIDGSGLRAVFEFLVNTVREILYAFEQRPLGGECLACVVVQLGRGGNVR